MRLQIWLGAVLAVVVPITVGAQTVSTTKKSVTETATIQSIDQTARTVTLKKKDGTTQTVDAGPEVKRFDELKVGDVVTARYYESVIYQVAKPGTSQAPTPSDQRAKTPGSGERPGGTIAQQKIDSVTVTAVDPATPSITVRTSDGHVQTYKVNDAKHLEGVAAGDRIDITYTKAMLIHVEPGPKS
jgi:hypothetical protein